MDFDLIMAYLLSVVIIVGTPGPNIILITNDSVKYGFKKSVLTILGIKAGSSLQFLISLSGLATLLAFFSSLFTVIKWIGVCYLIYLGVTQITSSINKSSSSKDEIENNSLFVKGFLVSVTNPKGLLFAGAFFPQFINSSEPIGSQVLILCGSFLIISSVIEILYAYAGDKARRLFKTDSIKKYFEQISGGILILFGIGLSLVKRNN
ncbi:MAG: LysE family translocator [Desulfobacterales bacterium]|nr:LysE family translocator [Desulfobacterales bacterium]MCP4161364.1 LysE family translocator [Deltaproteobacteria bacterium]